jgi:hypothetical protein
MTEALDFPPDSDCNYINCFTPDNLIFDSDLQEFTRKLDILCSLEETGKIKAAQAYEQIKKLCEKIHNMHE